MKSRGNSKPAWGRPFKLLAYAGLFAAMWWIYDSSVPPAFNTNYSNRRYFDSDGEFITRQFSLGKTYTHNDHLLYHVLARELYELTAAPPAVFYDSVPQHRWLSIAAGALGVVLLLAFGRRASGSTAGALAAALLIGGSAGWWFFAATIDTYLPHMVFMIASLGCTLLLEKRPSRGGYVALGACLGMAFLLRLDGVLLIPLAVVAALRGSGQTLRPRDVAERLAWCAAAGFLVGGVGYAVLARTEYDVAWPQVIEWALGHRKRPEVAAHAWGSLKNLTPRALGLTLVNQTIYAVVLPGLESTRSLDMAASFRKLSGGWFTLGAYVVLLVAVFSTVVGRKRWYPLAMIAAWIGTRTLFYAWWNPWEPFLFACLSLPALWLLALEFVTPTSRTSPAAMRLHVGLISLLAVIVWWHNYRTMIAPLKWATP